MKITRMATQLALWGIAAACTAVLAQGRVDVGKREYDNNCAVCHGRDGKGSGVYSDMLTKSAPNLTSLTQRNGGVFPVARVYDVIEGAGVGHGTREMPIWGRDYSIQAAEYYMDVPYNQEAYVRGRILSLVEYLNRLQVK
jgi:mono/diheme cytochrome c family protein